MTKLQSISQIRKRDASIVNFDIERIAQAIYKAMQPCQEGSLKEAQSIAEKVNIKMQKMIAEEQSQPIPSVETIQDIVEASLIEAQYAKTAKAYILYRVQHAQIREQHYQIPEHLRKLVETSRQYFRNPLSEFVYYRTYSRWIEEEQRRETWLETVERYIEFIRENLGEKLNQEEYNEIREAILKQQVMPSMRLLQFSGKAARTTNVCAYNCSYLAPSCIQDFGEVMYISMCGTGVGFSVESKNVQALPQIKMQTDETLPTHVIKDSKEGWCEALILGMTTWFEGKDIHFDYTKIRPAGTRLKTIGGKSSGPDPLHSLLDFTRVKILQRQGRRLLNIDAHDILCKIGEIVVAGGVRRSAMISLSDLDDQTMRDAKKGQFYYNEPQRSIANNSAVYESKPNNTVFLEEWTALMKSGSGERGIFNRSGLSQTLPERRLKVLQEFGDLDSKDQIVGMIGTNPCGEIILRSKEFCNLTEIVARHDDDEASLLRKVRIATLLGTYQATLTNFPFLSKEWKENCERERLLGVSITGQWDCHAVRNESTLEKLKQYAIEVNQEYSKRFGINESTCITCIKPSGNVSQTVDCSSGMHPRHAPFYIRRIRISATDSLLTMLKEQGIPYHPEVGQTEESATTFVIEFPVKSPEGSIYRDNLSALEQLEYWKMVKMHFTEHNPSVTISVSDDEWIAVANWLYENWEIIGGLSFLPRSNHVYQLAPYEEIDEKTYNDMLTHFKNIDYAQIVFYEKTDETELKRELACVGGECEMA